MKSKFIKISNVADINVFCSMASKVFGDIEVRKGRWCIDAKSIMGMHSIDTSTGVTVVYPDDANDFESYIEQFEVK